VRRCSRASTGRTGPTRWRCSSTWARRDRTPAFCRRPHGCRRRSDPWPSCATHAGAAAPAAASAPTGARIDPSVFAPIVRGERADWRCASRRAAISPRPASACTTIVMARSSMAGTDDESIFRPHSGRFLRHSHTAAASGRSIFDEEAPTRAPPTARPTAATRRRCSGRYRQIVNGIVAGADEEGREPDEIPGIGQRRHRGALPHRPRPRFR